MKHSGRAHYARTCLDRPTGRGSPQGRPSRAGQMVPSGRYTRHGDQVTWGTRASGLQIGARSPAWRILSAFSFIYSRARGRTTPSTGTAMLMPTTAISGRSAQWTAAALQFQRLQAAFGAAFATIPALPPRRPYGSGCDMELTLAAGEYRRTYTGHHLRMRGDRSSAVNAAFTTASHLLDRQQDFVE